MTGYAIRSNMLSRSFKNIRALDQITFDVPKGIVFGFIGPNGAGKTTTIRMLLGLIEPDSGSAEVLGFDTRTEASRIREKTGALLEHTGLYERLTAEDNLEFYGRVYRIPNAERKARIRELLERFGLWERRSDRVGEWSRGMKQKLAVARSMINRPSLLFLDEPTAGLDPVAAAGLRDIIEQLVSDEGMTVFLTTHNLSEAEKLCSSVGVITRGRLVTVGPPGNLISGDGIEHADIRCRNVSEAVTARLRTMPGVRSVQSDTSGYDIKIEPSTSLAPIIRLLVESGIDVEEARREKTSLEEAFLTLMKEEE